MMSRHVIAPVGEMPPGSRKLIQVGQREVAIFNVGGKFFGIGNRCPHEGAPLCKGLVVGLAVSDQPGEYKLSREGEILRCPWHGWEFDIRTGRSWCDPDRIRVKSFDVQVQSGEDLQDYAVETYPVSVEHDYVVLHIK
jgi:3-phenylpropionate/trans-cinnamate dioxygenase ferredoxin subunit